MICARRCILDRGGNWNRAQCYYKAHQLLFSIFSIITRSMTRAKPVDRVECAALNVVTWHWYNWWNHCASVFFQFDTLNPPRYCRVENSIMVYGTKLASFAFCFRFRWMRRRSTSSGWAIIQSPTSCAASCLIKKLITFRGALVFFLYSRWSNIIGLLSCLAVFSHYEKYHFFVLKFLIIFRITFCFIK